MEVNKKTGDLLKLADSIELSVRFEEAKETLDLDDDRTDIQILKDEAQHLIDLYSETGTSYSNELKAAKKILADTKDGKEIPLNADAILNGGKIYKYTKQEVELAINLVAEVSRLKKLVKKLSA